MFCLPCSCVLAEKRSHYFIWKEAEKRSWEAEKRSWEKLEAEKRSHYFICGWMMWLHHSTTYKVMAQVLSHYLWFNKIMVLGIPQSFLWYKFPSVTKGIRWHTLVCLLWNNFDQEINSTGWNLLKIAQVSHTATFLYFSWEKYTKRHIGNMLVCIIVNL